MNKIKDIDIPNINLHDDYSNISLKELGEKVSTSVQAGIKNVKDTTKDAVKSTKDQLRDARENIKSTSQDAIKSVNDQFKDAVKNVKGTTKDIVDSMSGGNAVHSVNKFNPVFIATRGAVLSILNNNIVDIANAFSLIKDGKGNYWNEIQQKWWMWGGEKSKLSDAVDRGKDKKPLFKDLIESYKGKSGFNGVNYSNIDGSNAGSAVATSAALLGTASGVLLSIPEPTATTKVVAGWLGTGAVAFGAMNPILKKFAQDNNASPSEIENIPISPDLDYAPVPKDQEDLDKIIKDINSSNKILGMSKTTFWISITALVGVASFVTYRILKK